MHPKVKYILIYIHNKFANQSPDAVLSAMCKHWLGFGVNQKASLIRQLQSRDIKSIFGVLIAFYYCNHVPASSEWPFDHPNGGHLSPEKVTRKNLIQYVLPSSTTTCSVMILPSLRPVTTWNEMWDVTHNQPTNLTLCRIGMSTNHTNPFSSIKKLCFCLLLSSPRNWKDTFHSWPKAANFRCNALLLASPKWRWPEKAQPLDEQLQRCSPVVFFVCQLGTWVSTPCLVQKTWDQNGARETTFLLEPSTWSSPVFSNASVPRFCSKEGWESKRCTPAPSISENSTSTSNIGTGTFFKGDDSGPKFQFHLGHYTLVMK